MEKEYAIEFQGVSKIYTLKSKVNNKKKIKRFYALRDINIRIPKGEVVGILGTNGSGKSTLSMIVSGIVMPDEGKATMNGEQALIDINTGLNKQLTGFENITLKGALLGLRKREIEELTERVIDFAELGEFLYQPVKKYSSGMKSRLGFSINMCLNPEILIIDEALSVGDKGFAKKCMKKLKEWKKEGHTILFISHSISQIISFCDTAIWIESGVLREYGDVRTVSEQYSNYIKEYNAMSVLEKKNIKDKGFAERVVKNKDANRFKWIVQYAIGVMNFIYNILKINPTNKNKVLCISRQENKCSIDFQLLMDRLKEKREDIDVVFICGRADGNFFCRIKFLCKVIYSMYHLATSKVCILDAYWPAVSVLKQKEELKVVQMWHSIGKIKQSGYQTIGKAGGRTREIAEVFKMHENYDYVIAGGLEFNQFYQECFHIEKEKIRNIGLPRIDYLIESASDIRAKIYKQYPMLKETDKKIVLYAPTFRRTEKVNPLECLENENLDNYIFIVKSHAYQKLKFQQKSILNCPKIKAIELLTVADYVITDYSAIALEAAVLNKKTLYYLYDYDEYVKQTGLNLDPMHVVPEYSFKDIKSVFNIIDKDTYDSKVLERYRMKYLPRDLGNSTEKLSDFILSLF